MTTSITAHSAENHPVITYQNVRVTTTELLAQFYGTDVIRIQQNFTRNADRFVEGKHYFKLEGENLRQFKQLGMLSFSEYPALKTTSRLTLWTQRGAARHAKILDTDKAWDVFEQLEDAYFKSQPITPALPTDLPTALRMYADQLERTAKLEQKLEAAAPAVAFTKQVLVADKTYTFTEVFGLLKHYTCQTFTGVTFLQFLREQGIACHPNPHKNIGKRKFVPRADYINSWFIAQLTPTGETEWLMRPIAVHNLIMLIEGIEKMDDALKELPKQLAH